jgi:hypothetical protein
MLKPITLCHSGVWFAFSLGSGGARKGLRGEAPRSPWSTGADGVVSRISILYERGEPKEDESQLTTGASGAPNEITFTGTSNLAKWFEKAIGTGNERNPLGAFCSAPEQNLITDLVKRRASVIELSPEQNALIAQFGA